MASRRAVSVFTALWLLVFGYETVRYAYLDPLLGVRLPKVKLLFPPAGWIMFYRVDEAEGHAEVRGLRGGREELIDPHRIFATRWVGYDNIRRNVLITALEPAYAASFCRYLRRKFPQYEGFAVQEVVTPSVIKARGSELRQTAYRCP
ncbi:MAG: hypothetical protein HY926_12235 [Elusimicrobia bacterium]|nr:hypothetical protein [Elusimicrobiota bacterium]